MDQGDTVSSFKKTLQIICHNNGWSYGVFWRFDDRNSMLLAMEDFYYEQQLGMLVHHMLPQIHILGEGMMLSFSNNFQLVQRKTVDEFIEIADNCSDSGGTNLSGSVWINSSCSSANMNQFLASVHLFTLFVFASDSRVRFLKFSGF